MLGTSALESGADMLVPWLYESCCAHSYQALGKLTHISSRPSALDLELLDDDVYDSAERPAIAQPPDARPYAIQHVELILVDGNDDGLAIDLAAGDALTLTN